MKVLVVQFSSLSNIVLASPVVRILKSELEYTLHFATRKELINSIEASPYLDKIHPFENSFKQLRRDLKKEKFDLVIDLDNSFKTRQLRKGVGAKTITFKKNHFRTWLMVNFKIDLLPNVHLTERYIKVLEPIGVKMDNLGLDFFIPEKDEVESDWLPKTHHDGYAVFAIGAEYGTRKLPLNRMIELCDRINKPIVLLGNKEDIETALQIEKFFQRGSVQEELEIEELNKKSIIFNACGKFSVNQSASIISKSNWVFTHESIMMYIAAAFKKPIYSIWGNTLPSFGRYPYRTQFTIFEKKDLSCRPCSSKGFEKCPKRHFKCMNESVFDFYLPD